MRRAADGRTLAAASLTTLALAGLTGCFTASPPPVPQASNADPIELRTSDAGGVREGLIVADGTTTLELQIDERSAVVLAAGSTDGEDLTMHLRGEGVDIEYDDREVELAGFAFEPREQDPLLAAVLEPGSYAVDLEEFNGDSTWFRLQLLVSTTELAAGEAADLQVAPGQPAVAIVSLTTGGESIAAVADFDSQLLAEVPGNDTPYVDDDSGGDRNPLIVLADEEPGDIVAVVSSYGGQDAGAVRVSVE